MTQSTTTQPPTLPLNPALLPDAPSWWPLAWGWWSLMALACFTVLLVVIYLRWRKKKLAPKKAALKIITNQALEHTPSAAIELLRQAALSYYPRERIAMLSGEEWYAFLDSQISQPRFTPNSTVWQQALYQKPSSETQQSLIEDCQIWIEQALPPKRGGRE
ncbi:DUF4381 domain-containing protein [Vibrio genomosp. F6]|uniref:DUF4381 domain-containing protein n=1 Tax=Vibrio genomosp. F6 str. FF-238 TaxID=1191298 RepID=A0A1E5CMY9_9VIBR|nr:DUF4381 domain-containing protein [Vibrio genomosp. F6]OEE70469.1 hypothetical protein A130_08865 [Vibrio genomosp. F6 str. FF-238]